MHFKSKIKTRFAAGCHAYGMSCIIQEFFDLYYLSYCNASAEIIRFEWTVQSIGHSSSDEEQNNKIGTQEENCLIK